MYSEWSSLVDEIRNESSLQNVLEAYPTHGGKDVVNIVLKSLTDPPRAKDLPMALTTHEQVKWTMEVISYGLALPLTEHKLMHLCIDVYDSWLSAIYEPKKSVPKPVKDTPDIYVQIIFKQLSQVFTQRHEAGILASQNLSNSTAQLHLDNQALLCKRVLQICHHVVIDSRTKMARETWDCLLVCLLCINDTILSPPPEPNSIAANLKAMPVHVLFEAWLRASISCFPRPQLWKSLLEFCVQWRHHGVLAVQWTRLTYTLTYQVIINLYTGEYLTEIQPSNARLDSDFRRIITEMPYDVLVQCWYRVLHALGNPVELAYPKIIGKLPAFQRRVSGSRASAKQLHSPPTESHLAALPRIYHELMRGVATVVYLFLGQDVGWNEWDEVDGGWTGLDEHGRHDSSGKGSNKAKFSNRSHWYVNPVNLTSPTPKTPPLQPRATSHTTTDILACFAELAKPRGNTLLQLFGSWLFQAAIWPITEDKDSNAQARKHSLTAILSSMTDLTRPSSSNLLKTREPEFLLRYEKGRAEAFGALCSIFSTQPCGEPFKPLYLARFYHALILGLSYSPEFSNGHILTEIILHSSGLLRKNLMGINLVLPYLVDALKLILPCPALPFKWVVNLQALRHASIDLLLSMLSLPLHFLNQPLPNIFCAIPDLLVTMPAPSNQPPPPPEEEERKAPLTFLSLREHLVSLIFEGILNERGHTNKQLLLHALNVIVQDIVTYESALSKATTEEGVGEEGPPEGEGVSSSLRPHMYLQQTRSDASTRSHTQLPQLSEYDTSALVSKAITICRTCLFPAEGEAVDIPVQISLAALELLSSVAQLQFENFSHQDSRYAVQLVSEFIETQAMKDLPRHNRDLHTSIVAAFTTLLVWVQAHPYLLGSKASLSSVMRVIELGISGRFSTEADGTGTYKGLKKERPISGRVKEIAEFMLYSVMEKVSSFPSPCGAESASSLLTEEDILNRLPPERREEAKFQYFLMDSSVLLGLLEEPFTNSSNTSSGGPQGHTPLPTVTAVVRSPSGRHVWSMQLRHHPRSEQPSTSHLRSGRRPSPKPCQPLSSSSVERKPWPDEVHLEPPAKVDSSIPNIEDVLTDSTRPFHDKIFEITKQQVQTEEGIQNELENHLNGLPYPNPLTALEPPRVQESFRTARLFLNHFGLLSIEGVKEVATSHYQPLAVLDSTHFNFPGSLAALDRLPSRFCNTIFVLHCKEGLVKPEEILAAQSSLNNKPPEFLEFLHGLGWIVNPKTHPGFAGKLRPSKTEDSGRLVSISAQIPARPFPYYADALTELAFIMPTLRPSASDSSASLRSVESSDSSQDVSNLSYIGGPPSQTPSALQFPTSASTLAAPPATFTSQMSQPVAPLPQISTPTSASGQHSPLVTKTSGQMYMNIDEFPSKDATGSVTESQATAEGYSTYPLARGVKKFSRTDLPSAQGSTGSDTPRRKWVVPQDGAALVVWLEKFEDHMSFPTEVLSGLLHGGSLSGLGSHKFTQSSRKSLPVIFIHMLSSGLYQIVTNNSAGRSDGMAGPLVDGMVVNRRTLSVLVRQTALNMCNRHRMENDGFSPPHVKRKRKLEEMAKAYKLPLSVAEFYTRLFTGQSES